MSNLQMLIARIQLLGLGVSPRSSSSAKRARPSPSMP